VKWFEETMQVCFAFTLLAEVLRTLPDLFMQCLPKELVLVIGHLKSNPAHWLLLIILAPIN
jgi:hypothetical protein